LNTGIELACYDANKDYGKNALPIPTIAINFVLIPYFNIVSKM
jgi:hypothetical protein